MNAGISLETRRLQTQQTDVFQITYLEFPIMWRGIIVPERCSSAVGLGVSRTNGTAAAHDKGPARFSFCGTVCILSLFPAIRHRGAPRKHLVCGRYRRILNLFFSKEDPRACKINKKNAERRAACGCCCRRRRCCCCYLGILNLFLYPMASAAHPVSVLNNPREMHNLWSQTERKSKIRE